MARENENVLSNELTESIEYFIANGNVSIDNIYNFYKQLGPLNKTQRIQIRQQIAQAINSGQTQLIQ